MIKLSKLSNLGDKMNLKNKAFVETNLKLADNRYQIDDSS